jgi:zinc protease
MKRSALSSLFTLLVAAAFAVSCAHQPPPPPPPVVLPAPPPIVDPEPFRVNPPAALEVPMHFVAPVPVELKLANGARVWISERHELPLVSVMLVMPAGIDHEPKGKAGVAGITTSMLTEGTQSRSSEKIAQELEDLAIDLGSSSGGESTTVGMNSLHETLAKGMDVFADVVLHPAFRQSDFQRIQKMALTDLEQKKGIPEALASDAMSEKLYGANHPWGQPAGGTVETVGRLKPKDLVDFHHRVFVPDHALFLFVGDVTQDEVMKLLESKFKGWTSRVVVDPPLPPFPSHDTSSLTVIDRPGSQSQLWLGGPLFAANFPDAIPARISNLILGGMFSSRLNQALREDKGYSYGFFSNVQLMRNTGVWVASGSVESRYIHPALEECSAQLKRYASDGPTDEELKRARERFIGSLPGMFETNGAMAGALSTLDVHDLPRDYFRTLPERVAKVTRDDVLRVNRQYLHPEKWPIVIVGPESQLKP